LQKISAWQEIARRLAHEIKNPLTPIRLAMQQVHDTYCGTDEKFTKVLEDAHEIVREEVDALRHMVEEFSAFAKLPQVRPEPESIGVLMDEFLRSLAATPGAENVRWHKPDQDVDIVVDRILFKRVLYNLVLNALQAGVEGGKEVAVEIRARAHRRDDTVEIRVDDNGPGIDEELRERIFDPYFTTKDEGTGLGLAIVKKILLEHKGAIDVADSPLGGARFVITVPRKPAGATPTAKKKASQEETKS
jgi:nitrogen fixation/metabolism regulation signal transduction histidine kinase